MRCRSRDAARFTARFTARFLAQMTRAIPLALFAVGCGSAAEQASSQAAADSAAAVTVEAPRPVAEVALRAALEQTLQGPAPSATNDSWFSATTAGALRTVSVDAAGHAVVDFVDLQALIPNAGSSAGSAVLLDELNATVFGVDGVQSVDYLMEGSCERFWEWLQYSCQTVHRTDNEPATRP